MDLTTQLVLRIALFLVISALIYGLTQLVRRDPGERG